MKLIVKNFRCYKDKIFDFGDKGLVLLSGPSGIGKTSVLMAIQFALYGVGTNIITEGCTSCSVEIYIEEMYIKRTKKPNRLVLTLSDSYEDESAQEIINKKFGETFDVCGYIAQNAIGTFILMSPIEKLEFLERIVFQDIDLIKIKTKCKELIRINNEKLISTVSNIEMISNILQTKTKPEYIKYPLNCGIKNRIKGERNENIKHKNCIILIKRKTKDLHNIKIEYNDLMLYNQSINSKKYELSQLECKKLLLHDKYVNIITCTDEELSKKEDMLNNLILNRELNDKIVKITTELESIKTIYDKTFTRYNYLVDKLENINYEGVDKIIYYEKCLNMLLTNKEFINLKEKYNNDLVIINKLKEDETHSILDNIKLLSDKLWLKHSMNESIEFINKYKKIIKDLRDINDMEFRKNEYYKNINNEDPILLLKELNYNHDNILERININKELLKRIELEKQLHTCPVCNSKLKLDNNKLCIIENNNNVEVNNENKIKEKIKEDTILINNIKKDINKILLLKDNIDRLDNDIITLKMQTIELSDSTEYNLESVNEKLLNEEMYMNANKSIENEIKELDKRLKLNIYSQTLNSLIIDSKQLLNKINELEKKMSIRDNIINLSEYNEDDIREKINNQNLYKQEYDMLNLDINRIEAELIEYEENINNKQKELENIKSIFTQTYIKDNDEIFIDIDENDLRTFINNNKSNKKDKYRLECEIKELECNINTYNKNIEYDKDKYVKIYNTVRDIDELNAMINNLNLEIEQLEQNKIEIEDNLRSIERYIQYEKELEEYESWNIKIEKLKEQEIEYRNEYTASCTLKDKIVEAESLSMINIIESINQYVQIYLEDFFPENPILIRLLPFKETKKSNKPQINIEIEYKCMNCDIKSLSGGELDRVILAFTLALGDMFNIPLFMLDEVTSSLDQEMNSIIIESVKKHFDNKLVLVISHQSLTGIYDRIINL